MSKKCLACREAAAPATTGVKFYRVPSYLCAHGNTVALSPCVVCVAQKKIQAEKERALTAPTLFDLTELDTVEANAVAIE
jgi:hypothetical protein